MASASDILAYHVDLKAYMKAVTEFFTQDNIYWSEVKDVISVINEM